MSDFKVGDKVLVSIARRGGKPPEQRECTVVEVTPAGRVPKKKGFYSTKRYDHQSYIVADAAGERYRPIVSRISRADGSFGTPVPAPASEGPEPDVFVTTSAPAPAIPVTEYIICLDSSGSMSSLGLAEPTRRAFNNQIAALRTSAVGEVFVTVYAFGSRVRPIYTRRPLAEVLDLTTFHPEDLATCLFDAIGTAIREAHPSERAAYVLQVLTDGGENVAPHLQDSVARALGETARTDRWTHAIMIPKGDPTDFRKKFPEIPAGNILEWDTTQAGAVQAGAKAVEATTAYMKSRSVGVTRTSNYFQPNLSSVTEADLARCTDLSPHFKRYEALVETTCRELAEEKAKKPYVIGSAFYQLTKREDDVQGYKQVLLRHRATGRIFGGAEARKLIGLQMRVDAKVEPGNHGDFEIYIESTSYNRILPRGAHMLHDFQMAVPKQPTWDHVGAHAAAEAKKANGVPTGSHS